MSGYSSSVIQSEILDLWNEGNMNSCPKIPLKTHGHLKQSQRTMAIEWNFPGSKSQVYTMKVVIVTMFVISLIW